VAQQNMTQIITATIMTLVTPKARAQHEVLFNKPATGLLNKGSCLARALGVTYFMQVRNMTLVTLCCAT